MRCDTSYCVKYTCHVSENEFLHVGIIIASMSLFSVYFESCLNPLSKCDIRDFWLWFSGFSFPMLNILVI